MEELSKQIFPSGDEFSAPLIQWYRQNRRELPWRDSGNPYHIWLSEVMLQQTRVDQALPYYLRFTERFPTIFDLAKAETHDVLVAWEGLGYYSRGRNLHEAAKTVVEQFNGKIPDNWDDIRNLKGVGDYTAAAVLSIAYNKPYAVVDGNVLRVLSRYLGIQDDIRQLSVRKYIQDVVSEWIPEDAPADFNQAMMDLGAGICSPRKPSCNVCPVQHSCVANATLQTDIIPYKSKAKKVPHHTIVVGIIIDQSDRLLIAKRPETVMLGGLWEFPGGKVEENESLEEALNRELFEELGVRIQVVQPFHTLKHAYSHFKITMHAFTCRIENGTPEAKSSTDIKWVTCAELSDFPFPKANRKLTDLLQNPA